MKIKNIIIKDLFGMFDYTIELNIKNRITFLHGPNGIGKTTILKIINDLFNMNFEKVSTVPFNNLTIEFTDSTVMIVARQPLDKDLNEMTLILTINPVKEKPMTFKYISLRSIFDASPYTYDSISDNIKFLERIDYHLWRNRRTGENLSFEDVHDKFGDRLPFIGHKEYAIPDDVSNFIKTININFIETQRLAERYIRNIRTSSAYPVKSVLPRRQLSSAVIYYADDLVQRIEKKNKQSAEEGRLLESTFPQRFLQNKEIKSATEDKIRKTYESHTITQQRFMDAGLFDKSAIIPLPTRKLGEHDLKFLYYYLKDVKQKLDVYESLLNKLELFKDIINRRFLFKTFSFDRVDGFKFISRSNVEIPLNSLSSGEQHEIVLTYKLLFEVDTGSLILIDEPELSLHVTWQQKFLKDITAISELADLDFLIATHSPQIVHGRNDLLVELKGN